MSTVVEKPAATIAQQPIRLDLRHRRDQLSRRLFSEFRGAATRVGALILGDLAAAAAATGLASRILLRLDRPAAGTHLPALLVLLLLCQWALRTYGPGNWRRDYERVSIGCVMAMTAAAVLGWYYPALRTPPLPFFVVLALTLALVNGMRRGIDELVRRLQAGGIGRRNVIVVGRTQSVAEVLERFERDAEPDIHLVTHIVPSPSDPTWLSELGRAVESQNVRKVIVSDYLPPDQIRSLARQCFIHGAALGVVPAILNEITCRISSRAIFGWPLLELQVPRLHLLQLVLKRSMDIAVAGVGVLLLSPILLLIAAAIRVQDPGPILFRQKRLGLGGRPFTLLKFRSMRVDAEQVLKANARLYQSYVDNNFKLPPGEDPRVSRLGRFLRRTSLDELPQLLNVLKGDMSLVGPRPIVPPEIDQYGEAAPVFLAVRPGVTGHWQINGRSGIGYPERADLELEYVKKWSVALDLKILLRTIPQVLRRNGAH